MSLLYLSSYPVFWKAHSSGLKVWIHCTKSYIFSENDGVEFMWCKSQTSGVQRTNLGPRARRVGVCVRACVSPAVKRRLCAFTRNETTAAAACVYVCVCADQTRLLFVYSSHISSLHRAAASSRFSPFHACCLSLPVHWLLCAAPSLAHKAGLIT